MYEFCKEKLEVTNSEEGKMLNSFFFFVSKDNVVSYPVNFLPLGIDEHIRGTQNVHQLINQPSSDSGVYKWCFFLVVNVLA